MSPGGWWLCLTLCPTSDHPKRTGDTSKPSKRLFGGSSAPARATSVGKMSRVLGKEGGFHQSKEQRSPEGPPNPTRTPQPPRPEGLLAAPMAGDCLGVRAAASQHPSQQPSSAEKVKTGFKQRLGPGKPSLRTLPIPGAGCSPGAAGSARIRSSRARQIPHPQSRETVGNGAAPSHPPVPSPPPGKSSGSPSGESASTGIFLRQ